MTCIGWHKGTKNFTRKSAWLAPPQTTGLPNFTPASLNHRGTGRSLCVRSIARERLSWLPVGRRPWDSTSAHALSVLGPHEFLDFLVPMACRCMRYPVRRLQMRSLLCHLLEVEPGLAPRDRNADTPPKTSGWRTSSRRPLRHRREPAWARQGSKVTSNTAATSELMEGGEGRT